MMSCSECAIDFEEKEEEEGTIFQCDICESSFHAKCVGVTKTDIKSRNKSKSLRLLCPDCIVSSDNMFHKKIHELVKIAYKIDMSCQQSKETEHSNNSTLVAMSKLLNALVEKVDQIDKKIISIDSKLQTNTTSSTNGMPVKTTYANVVSSKPVKPTVVIKPKQKQNSKKTLEELKNNVN